MKFIIIACFLLSSFNAFAEDLACEVKVQVKNQGIVIYKYSIDAASKLKNAIRVYQDEVISLSRCADKIIYLRTASDCELQLRQERIRQARGAVASVRFTMPNNYEPRYKSKVTANGSFTPAGVGACPGHYFYLLLKPSNTDPEAKIKFYAVPEL